ncbi:MAG TPA: sulfotransferase [Anaerolineales bacterium]|nr:sulfotransferase [Anaerolineales bacterium]
MPERIIVLGSMRSGTSLTAELTRLWGAYAGEKKNLWKSDFDDPRGYGYMEYIPLQELNDELLDNNDRVPPPIKLMEEKATNQKYREQALDLLRAMDEQAIKNQAPAWVWKDARLPLTLPFWVSLWEDVTYIVTIRHPAEITLSAAKAQEFQEEDPPFSAGLLYWQYCMLNVLTYTQNSSKKIFLAYDQLINNPNDECARLCDFLDTTCKLPQEGSEQRKHNMYASVSENQRHYDYHKSLAEIEQATKEQRALYNFLRVKTRYPDEAFVQDDFGLYPGWMDFLQSLDMLLTLSNKLDTWATQPPSHPNENEK